MSRPVAVVVPCSGAKLDRPAPAAELYVGTMFRHTLRAAIAAADGGDVFVLSALHGLVTLDQVVDPYDVRMGDADSIDVDVLAAQLVSHGLDTADVYAMLPAAYLTRLDQAARPLGVWVQDVYEADPGIGYQRSTCSTIVRTH